MDVLPFLWLSIYIYLPVFIRKCIYSFTVLGKNPTILKLFAQKTQVANEGSPFAKDELCWHVQEPQMKVCFFIWFFSQWVLAAKVSVLQRVEAAMAKVFFHFYFIFFYIERCTLQDSDVAVWLGSYPERKLAAEQRTHSVVALLQCSADVDHVSHTRTAGDLNGFAMFSASFHASYKGGVFCTRLPH